MRVGRQGSGIHARLAEEHAGQLATAANSIDRVAKKAADDDACLFAQLQVTWIGLHKSCAETRLQGMAGC